MHLHPHLDLRFRRVHFSWDSALEPLFRGLDLHLDSGWTGVVGANGVGKTTLLRLATGALVPDRGQVERPPLALYCAQRVDEPPALLPELLVAQDAHGCRLKGRLGLDWDWAERWSTLSHGEQKRAQVAVALWRRPDLLALDEPSNHLDGQARQDLQRALAHFQGVGLLVSHDRALLDALCVRCLFLSQGEARLRRGNWSAGEQQEAGERESLARQRSNAQQGVAVLERRLEVERQAAARSRRRRSRGRLAPGDADGRARVGLAILTGKDARPGRKVAATEAITSKAREHLATLPFQKEYAGSIWIPGAFSQRDFVLLAPRARLWLGTERHLEVPELSLHPRQRVALTGPNGAGKTTLLHHLLAHSRLPPERVIVIPQEIFLSEGQQVMQGILDLPGPAKGRVMEIVSRLGSRPEALFHSAQPSPGELRKLMLAQGILREPHLVVLDEPTNHLDLPACLLLEAALAECPCALLLVSHDERFLAAVGVERWPVTAWTRG